MQNDDKAAAQAASTSSGTSAKGTPSDRGKETSKPAQVPGEKEQPGGEGAAQAVSAGEGSSGKAAEQEGGDQRGGGAASALTGSTAVPGADARLRGWPPKHRGVHQCSCNASSVCLSPGIPQSP